MTWEKDGEKPYGYTMAVTELKLMTAKAHLKQLGSPLVRKRRGFGPSASALRERLASVAALVPERPTREEACPDQGRPERHSPDQPLDHPTPRGVTSDALRGDRHRAR